MKLLTVKIRLLIAGIVLLSLATACERDTQVKITGGAFPDFVLSGSGRLGYLKITGPKLRDAPGEGAFMYWEIDPAAGYLNGSRLRSLSPIRYGEVPPGYVQKYPPPGEPMPALIEGGIYSAVFDTTGANRAVIKFTIREGQAIAVADATGNANGR